jgi:hypothetical protein
MRVSLSKNIYMLEGTVTAGNAAMRRSKLFQLTAVEARYSGLPIFVQKTNDAGAPTSTILFRGVSFACLCHLSRVVFSPDGVYTAELCLLNILQLAQLLPLQLYNNALRFVIVNVVRKLFKLFV